MSPNIRKAIHHIYDTVHAGLWALLCAGLAVVALVGLPHMSELRAAAETQRVLDIAAESRFYCERWGMAAGSPEYVRCTVDLQAIRATVRHRIADDLEFL